MKFFLLMVMIWAEMDGMRNERPRHKPKVTCMCIGNPVVLTQ